MSRNNYHIFLNNKILFTEKTGTWVTSMEEDLYDEFVSVEKEKKRND